MNSGQNDESDFHLQPDTECRPHEEFVIDIIDPLLPSKCDLIVRKSDSLIASPNIPDWPSGCTNQMSQPVASSSVPT